jgi:hypothetical protein
VEQKTGREKKGWGVMAREGGAGHLLAARRRRRSREGGAVGR